MIDRTFWKNRKVFITGHTGFKGSWLCLWLHALGAEVTGYALDPPTEPSLYRLCGIDKIVTTITADVRNGQRVTAAMVKAKPQVVIHMAAQPLVRESYKVPVETYETNVMGTVHVLEAVRSTSSVQAVVNVTTDKCYENRKRTRGYREEEPLGGYDPYSSSKACSEIVTAAYRSSYFHPAKFADLEVGVASARAGNVIGGGDWATDRLVPDCVRAVLKGEQISIRNPEAIRPWQHVLEPLYGYLLLAQKLSTDGRAYGEAWNFGPDELDAATVRSVVAAFCEQWGNGASYTIDRGNNPHEAHFLKLDSSKARGKLGWTPKWHVDKAIGTIITWTRAFQQGEDVRQVCLDQILEYHKNRS